MKVKIKEFRKSKFNENQDLLIFDDDLGDECYIALTPRVLEYIDNQELKVGQTILVIKSVIASDKKPVYLLKKVISDE